MARYTLAAVEQQSYCSEGLQQPRLSNLSQLVVVRTMLAAASVLCLTKQSMKSKNSTFCSQSIAAARSILAAASALNTKSLQGYAYSLQ